MIRAKIIDIIRSAAGSVLRIDNLAEYKETYTTDDMSPNTLVPFSLIGEILPSDYEIMIPAESPVPYVMIAGTDFTPTSLRPFVVQFQPVTYPTPDDTRDTTEGASLRVDYEFTSNLKNSLASISIYVADPSVDTWIRII